jgi:outer membrane protein assembly factor BamE (lipoprotein component of BamABCDE complex)
MLIFTAFGIAGCGCENNTEFASSFTRKKFEEVALGMKVEQVFEILGEPVGVYIYPKEGPYIQPEKISLELYEKNAGILRDIKVRLQYSSQIDPTRDYCYVSLVCKKNEVYLKIDTIAGD